MELFVHILIFLVAVGIIWVFTGSVVDAVSRIARRYCKSGFLTAFFVLGFITSIGEFSVAANSVLEKVPQVSAGNLVGASFVILLFIVPLLAIAGKGIQLNGAISKGLLGLLLAVIVLPTLLVLDGNVTRTEGFLLLLAYGTVAFALYRKRVPINACDPDDNSIGERISLTMGDVSRVVVGGVAIFFAAQFLVEESVYFATALSVPSSLIGLVLLSVGTNIPEIVIAFRSILRKRADIAFGDYLGSAAMNTLIFGLLAVVSGTFLVEASEFIMTAGLFLVGLFLLYRFAISKFTLSRREAFVLLFFYGAFLAVQIWNVVRFAGV